MSNLETVPSLYNAFAQGDIAAILECLAEDIEWDCSIGPNPVPWLQPRRGRSEVAGFFESLGELDFHRFEPRVFLEGDDIVVVLLDVQTTIKATGRLVDEEDEVHIWRFNSTGRVSRFTHKLDTLRVWAAFLDAEVP